MDGLAEELERVRGRAEEAHTGNLAHVESVLARLEHARAHLAAPPRPPALSAPSTPADAADALLPLSTYLKTSNATSQQLHKDWGTALSRLAKAVDKRFGPPPPPLFQPPPAPPPPSSLHPALLALAPGGAVSAASTDAAAAPLSPSDPTPFSAPDVAAALNATIATHLARIGAFDAFSTFLHESGIPRPPELTDDLLAELRALHSLVAQLKEGKCARALEWVRAHADADPDGELEYALRKEEYVRLVLAGTGDEVASATDAAAMDTDTVPAAPLPASLARRKSSLASVPPHSSTHPPSSPHAQAALAYGGAHFRPLLTPARAPEVCALLTAPLYLPLGRLRASPYAPLFDPATRTRATDALVAAFAAAFLKQLRLPRESPLTVVTDVGGGGALAKIMKVRAVMKEKKTEWSAVGELPVEIPLPVAYRYHSIFACPVSKEQSTAQNPPMLLPCGHVIARESLHRLARNTATLKCPYCPVVSHLSACVRVHF